MELLYKIALRGSLKQGYMGTEENVLSLILYAAPEVFQSFSNDAACEKNLDGDHDCKGSRNQHGNCAIFDWINNGPAPFRIHGEAAHEDGVAAKWGKSYKVTERLCLFEKDNWLVLFSEKECLDANGAWREGESFDRGFLGMGECTGLDGAGSVSWNERVNCDCYPNPCDSKDKPGECFHDIPGCVAKKCTWFPSAKGKHCKGGKCNGQGQCCDRKTNECKGPKVELPKE